jgi:hypothetical protein
VKVNHNTPGKVKMSSKWPAFKNHLLDNQAWNLQQRELLPICTAFPFNPFPEVEIGTIALQF